MTNDKALEAALLPCPHCGPGESVVEAWQDDYGYWRVSCGRCGSSSGTVPGKPTEANLARWPNPRASAIAAWNRRAPLSALPGEAEVVERLRKLTSPDAEMLSDGYRLTEIIKLNPADALQAMQARAEKAERERDYWQKLHDERTAFLGQCATEKEASEARVKELEAENARLRRLDAEYGRVETTIIMADPDFDGDSPHDNCGDRLIASVHRLRDLAALKGGSNG